MKNKLPNRLFVELSKWTVNGKGEAALAWASEYIEESHPLYVALKRKAQQNIATTSTKSNVIAFPTRTQGQKRRVLGERKRAPRRIAKRAVLKVAVSA